MIHDDEETKEKIKEGDLMYGSVVRNVSPVYIWIYLYISITHVLSLHIYLSSLSLVLSRMTYFWS